MSSDQTGCTPRTILAGVILPVFAAEHSLTRRVIEAIPEGRLGFRPTPDARSTGEIARHIVTAEIRYLAGAAEGAFSTVDVADVPASPSEMGAWYTDRFERCVSDLRVASDEALGRVLDYKGLVRMPAIGFVQFAMMHTIHHRGQLSTYFRLFGETVPPIYG